MYQRLPVIAVLFAALLTGPVLADPPPTGFELHKFNGSSAPVTEDGITTFHIEDEECSNVDFGDGRGESDCLNGSVRSMLRYERWAELGETLNYSMDILVEPGLEYEGYFNPDSAGFEPRGLDSHIRLASGRARSSTISSTYSSSTARPASPLPANNARRPRTLANGSTFP